MQKNESLYNVGDKVRFRTREISHHACRMAGTAISTNLEDYPEQEAIGTINQMFEMFGDKDFMYIIYEEHGFLCSMVFPEDIIEKICSE